MNKKIAEAINILGLFCGKRDVAELTPKCLKDKYDIEQADVMVLFGGSWFTGNIPRLSQRIFQKRRCSPVI